MEQQHSFSLDPSETSIFRGAAQIYAAYVVSGQVTPENDDAMQKKAINTSIAMAAHTDRVIQSDGEMPGIL
jgi:hypothetical protein